MHEYGYVVAREYFQRITWEIQEIYLLADKPFTFAVHIDRTVRFSYLINKFDFALARLLMLEYQKVKI